MNNYMLLGQKEMIHQRDLTMYSISMEQIEGES
jgi:hypothetical protein